MQRNIKRMITVTTVLVCVLLLISPVVLAKVFVKVDDEGLKSIQVRADIWEDGNPDIKPKNGRIQAMIREISDEIYSYKFMIDLRKAPSGMQYSIILYINLPEETGITIYGDGSGIWTFIKDAAEYFGIDELPGMGNMILTTVGQLLDVLEIPYGFIKVPTGMKFTTDERGNYKHIKEGIITEDDAMEYALDLVWPQLKEALELKISEGAGVPVTLPSQIDFADLGIKGMTIHGGFYEVAGYVKFDCEEEEYPDYATEEAHVFREWDTISWD